MNFNYEKTGLSWSTIIIIVIGVSLLIFMVSPGSIFMEEDKNKVSPKDKVAARLGINKAQLQFKGVSRNTLGYCGWVSTSRSPVWQQFLVTVRDVKIGGEHVRGVCH